MNRPQLVVNGRVLMHEREIDGTDEIVAKARERARRLGLKTPPQVA